MACACLAHVELSHTGGVLHVLPDRVALVFIPPSLLPLASKKGNSHTLFGRVASCPRGAVRQQEETWDTNSLASSW
jgi:hypothetical protein